MRRRNNKLYTVIGIMVLFLSMTMGYALFSNTVSVSGTAVSTGTYNISFRRVDILESVGCNPEVSISSDRNTLTINVPDLEKPSSYATINVRVRNYGTIPAELLSVDVTGDGDEDIKIEYPAWETGEVLQPSTNYVFPITIRWDEDSTITGKTISFTATLNYRQST